MALRLCRSALRATTVVASRRACLAASHTKLPIPRYSRPSSTATAAAALPADSFDPIDPPALEPMPFSALEGKISPETLKAITVAPFNLKHMTPVQEQVLSLLPALAQPPTSPEDTRDLLVRAKTGTGKTLAFLVPAIEARIHDIQQQAPDTQRIYARETVGALIISPTRELATQIAAEALKLSTHHAGFQVNLFVGGNSKRDQMRKWRMNRRDIVVATPGRLRDLLASEPEISKGLKTAKMLILDEVDTMLDIGFREDVEAVKRELGGTVDQTFLFSATVSPRIKQVASSFLSKFHKSINTVVDEDSPVHAHIPQRSILLPSAKDQLPTVMKLIAHDQLKNPKQSKIIIFLPTTRMVQLYTTLVRELAKFGGAGKGVVPAGKATDIYEIHSKKSQDQRSAASTQFRNASGTASILVTSDVSARGVDYPGVTRVIQIGIPQSAEQYIHRVGRTGRGALAASGCGDLILLPWEVGFLTWQLTAVPLQSVTVNEITEQVTSLAQAFDKDPKSFESSFLRPQAYTPVLQEIEASVEALQQRLDTEAIRETYLSLVGYYIGKSSELRVSKEVLLDGLKNWTTDGCGLSEPPYVSPQFLAKLGFGGDARTKRYGQRHEDREESRGGFRGNRSEGRSGGSARRWSDDAESAPSSRFSGGGGGGYKPRSSESSGGFRGGRSEGGGGYKGRSSDSGGGGYRGRSDSEGGGYRGGRSENSDFKGRDAARSSSDSSYGSSSSYKPRSGYHANSSKTPSSSTQSSYNKPRY